MSKRNKRKMRHIQPDNTHFFASSAATWMTTTPDRDLAEVLEAMENEGLTFNLFLVPKPHDADYQIKMYQPQVEGAVWLGTFYFEGESK